MQKELQKRPSERLVLPRLWVGGTIVASDSNCVGDLVILGVDDLVGVDFFVWVVLVHLY